MSCDVGEVMERLENELCSYFKSTILVRQGFPDFLKRKLLDKMDVLGQILII